MRIHYRPASLFRRFLPICILGSLAGCTPEAEPPGVAQTDSSGILIFSMGEIQPSSVREPKQILTLGSSEPGMDPLLDVRGLVFFEDGAFALLNAGMHEVRWYDSSGSLIASSGREGQGPGEFLEPAALWMEGIDTIAILDSQLGRVSTFDRAGRHLTTLGVPEFPRGMLTRGVGSIDDSTVVLVDFGVSFGNALRGNGPQRDSIKFFRLNASAGNFEPLTWTPGPMMQQEGSRVRIIHPRLSVAYAAGSNSLLIAPGDEGRINLYGRSGRLKRIFESFPAQRSPDSKQGSETRIVRRLIVDDLGRIWASGLFSIPDPPEASSGETWFVFSPEMGDFFTTQLPSRFIPFDIQQGLVIGVNRDTLDVEVVEIYDIGERGRGIIGASRPSGEVSDVPDFQPE